MSDRYIDSKEACRLLDVRRQTLYAYVSRGMVRSEPAGDRSRSRRYHREDVERLRKKQSYRADPSEAARGALRAGEPVLESALTFITDDAVTYRGQDVVALARERTIEEIAALLWTGDIDSVDWLACRVRPAPKLNKALAETAPLARMQAVLPLAKSADVSSADADSRFRTGWRILHLLTDIAGGAGPPSATIAERLQSAWAIEHSSAHRLLDAAMILCADHELNVSTFTARCVASSGASLYDVVAAALGALQGVYHGGASLQVEALLREIDEVGDVSRAVSDRLDRGERIAGFGHALYRGVDPRAKALLELLGEHLPGNETLQVTDELCAVVATAMGRECNVDLALATLTGALGLPRGSALVLFALGRSVGWIAHALEQYEAKALIRPRAAYCGVPPQGVE